MENHEEQDYIINVNHFETNDRIHEENINFLLSKYNIDKNKYIVPAFSNDSYNKDNVVSDNELFDLLCPICYNILKNPKRCSLDSNSHSFCQECIDKYLEESDNCPVCKKYFEYFPNTEIEKLLKKLKFKCIYYKDGCSEIISYSEYFIHINNCKFKNIIYECKVEKFNYKKKEFVKCCYRGDINDIEKHFKSCALLKYKCLFCNENILKINFREHLEDTFKVTIIIFSEGDKYIGEIKNGKSEGYGMDFYLNGDKYEGDYKDNLYDGYGIFNYINLDRYEGEFKNGKAEGYGIFYNSNGEKYLGEFKNGVKDGYGIYYDFNGGKYEGEFYNDLKDGFGILYYDNGELYIGEFFNDLKDGYGILYYSNGDKYKGEFKNNLREGYGIYYFFTGEVYEGEFKKDLMEGYGIINYSNGDIYKGELLNDKADGYGTIYYLNGHKYEGKWENGDIEGYGIDYHEKEINQEVELHENRSISYFGLLKLYLNNLLVKLDKFIFIKIICLIFIVYFLIIYLYK